jgi:hypothetical protein
MTYYRVLFSDIGNWILYEPPRAPFLPYAPDLLGSDVFTEKSLNECFESLKVHYKCFIYNISFEL